LLSFPALVCSSHSQTTTARLQVSVETLLCTEKLFAAIADLALTDSFFWSRKEEICGYDIIKVPDVIQQGRIGDRSVQFIHARHVCRAGLCSTLSRISPLSVGSQDFRDSMIDGNFHFHGRSDFLKTNCMSAQSYFFTFLRNLERFGTSWDLSQTCELGCEVGIVFWIGSEYHGKHIKSFHSIYAMLKYSFSEHFGNMSESYMPDYFIVQNRMENARQTLRPLIPRPMQDHPAPSQTAKWPPVTTSRRKPLPLRLLDLAH
jgi:hypothetical protein